MRRCGTDVLALMAETGSVLVCSVVPWPKLRISTLAKVAVTGFWAVGAAGQFAAGARFSIFFSRVPSAP